MKDKKLDLGVFPPQWILLADARNWLKSTFSLPASEFYRRLCVDLRDSGQIFHRLVPPPADTWESDIISEFDFYPVPNLFESGYHSMSNWQGLNFNFEDGTIDAPNNRTIPIEITWKSFEKWARVKVHELQLEKIRAAETAAAESALSKHETAHKSGRSTHDAVIPFARELIRLANQGGLPEKKGALNRHMTDWLYEKYGDNAPAETWVKDWLKKLDYRHGQK